MTTTHLRKKEDLAGLSVLIVDSNQDAADTLADLLSIYGCDARVAYAAEDALRAEPADVVILELRLPGMDGWDMVQQMRERPAEKKAFYLAVTTYYGSEHRTRSAETAIDLHLVKPVDPAVLIGVLKRFARVMTGGLPPSDRIDDGSNTYRCLNATYS